MLRTFRVLKLKRKAEGGKAGNEELRHEWARIFKQQTFDRRQRRERRPLRELHELFECRVRSVECGVDYKTTDCGTTGHFAPRQAAVGVGRKGLANRTHPSPKGGGGVCTRKGHLVILVLRINFDRNSPVRFDKCMVATGLKKSPVHEIVHGPADIKS